MQPISSEFPRDLQRLFEEQLARKDAQIEALTALLGEANSRLGQQQSILEGYFAARRLTTEPVASETMPEALNLLPTNAEPEGPAHTPEQEDGGSGTVAADEDGAGDRATELLGALAIIETRAAAAQEEAASGGSRLAPTTPSNDSEHSPIPMAYFGPPNVGFGKTLKRAPADPASDGDTDVDTDVPDQSRDPRHSGDPSTGGRLTAQSRQLPMLVSLGLVALVAVLAGVWKILPDFTSARPRSVQALASVKPAGGVQPQHAAAGAPLIPRDAPKRSIKDAAQSPAASPPGSATLPPLSSKPLPGSTEPPVAARPQDGQVTIPGATGADSLEAQLLRAVESAHLSEVRRLLARGADPNVANENGSSALAMAARYGYANIVNCLLDRRADVNIGNVKGWTPLMLAVNYQHPPIVKKLLQNGARTDLTNSRGTTALMLAAQLGNREMIRRLLNSGAATMVRNIDGSTAQDLAAKNGHEDVVSLLTEANSSR